VSIWSGAEKAEISCRGREKIGSASVSCRPGDPIAEALSLSSLPDHSAHRLDRRKIDADCAVLLGAPQRLASWIQLLATLGAAMVSGKSEGRSVHFGPTATPIR